jgi:thiamine-phosphate pyrophosphorylase
MIWVATTPASIPGELSHINSLLSAGGLEVLLLRKPGFSALEYERLLEGIDPIFYSRIMIAGEPALVKKYGLRGLHMSEAFRASADVEGYSDFKLSTSIHEGFENWVVADPLQDTGLVEVRCTDVAIDHLILGPVFNSISKPGYSGRLQEMKNIPSNALAIGGITENNIGVLRPMGFCGAVLLGAIWNDPFNAVHTYQSIKAAWNRT